MVDAHAVLLEWQLKVLEDRSLVLWDPFVGVRPVEGMDFGLHARVLGVSMIPEHLSGRFNGRTLATF